MEAKTIDIKCSECSETITMSAQDAHIEWRFNGGCPRLKVTVQCPHCQKSSVVKDTPEARGLLSERLKNQDYDSGGVTIITNSPETYHKLMAIL